MRKPGFKSRLQSDSPGPKKTQAEDPECTNKIKQTEDFHRYIKEDQLVTNNHRIHKKLPGNTGRSAGFRTKLPQIHAKNQALHKYIKTENVLMLPLAFDSTFIFKNIYTSN